MKKKNNLITWIIIIVILALLAWLATNLANNNTPNTPSDLLKIQTNDWVKGDPQAKLIIIQYSDFQCPACKVAAFYEQLLATDSSNLNKDVAIVFRHFPLESLHANAYSAALAAEAAGAQGKFWEMHDMLFDKQDAWAASDNITEVLTNYAQALGLDTDKFKTDLNAKTSQNKVDNNLREGNADQLNISYTPTMYLNGEIINLPNSYDKFRQLLQSKLGQ